ncbi:MAG: hypothetical protein WC433_08165 [Candidatus Omnitrophota bacterium]
MKRHSLRHLWSIVFMVTVLAVYAFLMWLILWTSPPPESHAEIDLAYHGADMVTEGWKGELVAYRFDVQRGCYRVMWKRKGIL